MKYKWIAVPIIGNLFEWYEFTILASLASFIGAIFFDTKNELSAIMSTFMIYGIGFLVRPIGTYFFGYIGDKYGRKKALSSSMLLMSLSTLTIPFIPSYKEIGVLSSVLLIIARIIQGFSFGGEYSSVVTYTCEMAPNGKKGLLGSLQVSSIFVAVLLGLTTVLFLQAHYTNQQIQDFAWKIPFYFAILLGFLGFYLRFNSKETPEFLLIKNNTVKNPFITVFTKYYKEFFVAAFWIFWVACISNTFTTGIKAILEVVFGVSSYHAIVISMISCVTMIVSMTISGYLIDFSKNLFTFRKYITILSTIGTIIAIFLLTSSNLYLVFLGIIFMSFTCGIMNGTYPYYFYTLFPTQIRDTSIGFSLSIPSIFGSGFSVVTFLWLYSKFNIIGAFTIFLGSLVAVLWFGFFIDTRFVKKHCN